jgi:phosphatidate cytidylyltransferase
MAASTPGALPSGPPAPAGEVQPASVAGDAAGPGAPRGRNLAVAVPTALGLIALLLISLYFSPFGCAALVCVALVLALREMTQALAQAGFKTPYIPLAVGSVATQVAAVFSGPSGAIVGLFMTLAAATLWRALEFDYKRRVDGAVELPGMRPVRSAAQDVYATAFVTLYLPAQATLVVLLSMMKEGRWLVLLLVAIPVASDTGGYFAGSYFGKHKLAPNVSPKKTWEGLAGSVLLATAAGVGGMALMGRPWYFGFALAVFGALAATLGDLAESMLKRAIGVKDMGTLLPGHGGVLDRVDSILMTAPFAYVLITLVGAGVFG